MSAHASASTRSLQPLAAGLRSALLLALLASLWLHGCFSELIDRDCADNEDCFTDEVCLSGLCQPVLISDAGDQPDADDEDTFAARVEVFSADDRTTPRQDATINLEGDSGQCNCQPDDDGACAYEGLAAGQVHTFCAALPGHRSCRRPAAFDGASPLRVTLILSACPQEEPDCATPLPGCGCQGLPLCPD